MSDQLEALLRGSLIVAQLRKQVDVLTEENVRLKRDVGRLRLMRDLRSDFDQSCDDRPSIFHRRQAE